MRGAERIELVRVDPNTGKLESIVEAHVFAQIRSVSSFKLTGGTKGQSSSHPLALPWSRLHALAVHARPARRRGRSADPLPLAPSHPAPPRRLPHRRVRLWADSRPRVRRRQQLVQQAPPGNVRPVGRTPHPPRTVPRRRPQGPRRHGRRHGEEQARLHPQPCASSLPLSPPRAPTGALADPGSSRAQDAAANLTISSPLEAHKPRAIIHSIVGVDVGFENPMFAALEVDYTEADQDPTGAAFEATEKVRLASLPLPPFSSLAQGLTSPSCRADVDVLRARPRPEPRRAEMERADRPEGEPPRARCAPLPPSPLPPSPASH